MTLEYDGGGFHGFQSQGELRTVQSEVESALSRLFSGDVKVVGAGRTDAGVHARAQVVSSVVSGSIPTRNIARAANSILPKDIALTAVREMPPGFDANRSAQSKVYRYYYYTAPNRSAFCCRYACWIGAPLDVGSMRLAAGHFVGSHDFSAFRAAGSAVKTSVRDVLGASVSEIPENRRLVCFEVEATGFLYNMVRIMAGTLLEVGRGKMAVADVRAAVRSKERASAGPTAPPQGLWLWEVRYPASFS